MKTSNQLIHLTSSSLKRLRNIVRETRKISLLRALEYEHCARLKLSGRILDYGGGAVTKYNDRFKDWCLPGYEYESVNIDPEARPTYLVEVGEPLPIASERYDAVISLNTFEHVYDNRSVFREIARVLRPGGQFTYSVPFLFRVHGHPDDYIRGTPNFWLNMLQEAGFEDSQFELLSWGPFSTGQFTSGLPGPLKRFRMLSGLSLDLLYSALNYDTLKMDNAAQDNPLCAAPLGYFVTAIRKL